MNAKIDNWHHMRTALTRWVDFDDQQWSNFAAIFREKRLAAQERVILPGDKAHRTYFVCQGLLRVYYVTDDGKESNKGFVTEGAFGGPMAASALDLPVLYGVQALESTTLLVAPYRDFAAFFDQHPVFDRLGRKIAESILIHKELRERSLLLQNASERYLDFLKRYKELVPRIPQYHIASYLGISEVSLSRIRRNLAIDSDSRS